jgi:hypothetical protein
MEPLDLGWCQGYMALEYHMEDAYIEKGINVNSVNNPPFAIFSKKYYEDICNLNNEKIYDYCFIGSLAASTARREWVVKFAKEKFTNNSIFVNTDNDVNWKLLGSFDKSNEKIGFCPRAQSDHQSRTVQLRKVHENLFYFQTMCQSKYILCPAGDSSWSFRFYETLLCSSIPIVESWHHTYRTVAESKIKYKYILQTDTTAITDETYKKLNLENTILFKKHHML